MKALARIRKTRRPSRRKTSSSGAAQIRRTGSGDAWTPLKTAPRDGTELIFWVSSHKGFQDITANFYFRDGAWWWASTDEPLKRPDLVNGWMRDPHPPPASLTVCVNCRTLHT